MPKLLAFIILLAPGMEGSGMIAAHHSVCAKIGVPCIETRISGGYRGGYELPFDAYAGYRFELCLSILSDDPHSDGGNGILIEPNNRSWRVFSLMPQAGQHYIYSDLDSTDQGRRTAIDITQYLDRQLVLSVSGGTPHVFCGDTELQTVPVYSIQRPEAYPSSVMLLAGANQPIGRRFFWMKVYGADGSITHDYIPRAKGGEPIVVDGVNGLEYRTSEPDEYRFTMIKGG